MAIDIKSAKEIEAMRVAGRMAAYEDGMTKLLSPEKRLGIKSIKVTTEDSALPPTVTQQLQQFVPGLDVSLLRVPKGTPINLLMNVHPKDLPAVVQAYVDGVLQGAPKENGLPMNLCSRYGLMRTGKRFT